jgi:electron transport complex protein RnfE
MRDELKKSIFFNSLALVLGIGLLAPLLSHQPWRIQLLLGFFAIPSLIVTAIAVAYVAPKVPANVRIAIVVLIAAGVLTIDKVIIIAHPWLSRVPVESLTPLLLSVAVIAAATEAYDVKKKMAAALFDGVGIGLCFTIAISLLGSIHDAAGRSGFAFDAMKHSFGNFFLVALAVVGLIRFLKRKTGDSPGGSP